MVINIEQISSDLSLNLRRLRIWRYRVNTIWLFTINDLKSIVAPETAFGICSALSGSQLTTNTCPDLSQVLSRLPEVILWNWLNLLIFDLANQSLESSILEDRVNKPWRPIPSGRLTALEARIILLWTIPVAVLFSLHYGGAPECIAMLGLTWMYNDLGGADLHYVTRNLINAFGFICYSSGSASVATGHGLWELNERSNAWLMVIWAIVLTTLQVQEMADVKGDAARGRRTLPLVHGQFIAKLSIAIPVLVFSIFCPWFWQMDAWGYGLPSIIGAVIAFRTFKYNDASSDVRTFKCWCAWTGSLYLLPLLKEPGVFERALG